MKIFRKGKKQKIINGCKGAISILLCVLITPFLGIASALIEFSRYQSTAETLSEVIDLSTLSTLANYDSYVQDRFGLFSLSQDINPTTEFNSNLENNIELLNKGITNGSSNTAYGSYPLSNLDILKRQVLDFSESTVLSDFLLEDLNIQDLIDKLNNLKGLASLAEAASDMSNLATSIKELVEAGNTFADHLKTAYNSATTIKTNIDDLLKKMADLYKKLSENGITINDDTNFNDIVSNYKDDLEAVFGAAKTLYDSISGFTSSISNLPSDFNTFKSAFDKAKTALAKAKSSSSANSNANKDTSSADKSSSLAQSTSKATDIFETIINEFDSAINKAATDIKDTTITSIKNAANQLKDDLYAKFKLSKYLNLDEYLSVPLSDEAKGDLKQILSKVPSVWTTNSYDELLNTLSDIYVPDGLDLSNFTSMLNSLKTIITNSVNDASDTLKESTEGNLGKILTTLVDAVRGLFDLDIFYDGNLNAYLSDATTASLLQEDMKNPFETLLEAIEKMFTASDKFVESIGSFDLFGAIDAIVTLLDAVKDTLTSIVQLSQKIITKISELAGYISSGKLGKFYELLLLSAYLSHNLPNRTHSGSTSASFSFDNGISWSTTLNGKALTGFEYKDIVVSAQNGGTGLGTLDGLASFLSGASSGGSDTMFKGAELEYILAGTKSEVLNQAITFFDLYLLRMLIDIPVVFTDTGVTSMAASATIASWVVYLLVILGEPLCDTVLLVNGADSYLIKNNCYLTPAGIPNLLQKLADLSVSNQALKNSINGKLDSLKEGNTFNSGGTFSMSYDTHLLLILLVSTTENDMLTRLANIIQLESNQYYSKKGAGFTFDIKKSYTCITSKTTVTYNSFLNVFQFNDMSIFTRTYEKTRGY